MTVESWSLFALTCLIAATPGAGNVSVLRNRVHHGTGKSFSRIKSFFGTSENAVKTQLRNAVAV